MAEGALDIYRRTLGDVERINRGYGAAMDEQRQGYDTSMEDLSGAYANRDRGAPLFALASGLLAPTKTGRFGESVGAGLSAYGQARDKESQRDIERATKIAALREARAKLSQQALDSQRQMLPTQTGIAGGIRGIEQDNLAERLRREEIQRGERLIESLTGGAPQQAPRPPAPSGGFEGDPTMQPGSFGQEGDEGQPAIAPPAPAPMRPPAPQQAAPQNRFGLTEAQILILKSDPKNAAANFAKFAGQRDDLYEQAQKRKQIAADLGLKPGSPEHTHFVGTGQMPQPKDATRAVSELKAIREADTEVGKYASAEKYLGEAMKLIPNAFSGFTAGARGSIGESLGMGNDEDSSVYATQRLKQILGEEAIKQMGDALTGASTDYEMRKFLELYADSSASPKRKTDALAAVIDKLTAQRRLAEARSKDMRTGEYYKPGYTVPTVDNNPPKKGDVFSAADAIIGRK